MEKILSRISFVLFILVPVVLSLVVDVTPPWAAPYLVCDPQQDVSFYEIERDVKDMTGNVTSTVIDQSEPQVVTGGVRLYHDLFGLSIGVHQMRVSAVRLENVEGGATYARSDPVPFLLELLVKDGPSGLKLSIK